MIKTLLGIWFAMLAGNALAADVTAGRSDSTTVRAHGKWAPHLHTQAQDPVSQWQRVAQAQVAITGGAALIVLARFPYLYHRAPVLSIVTRVRGCLADQCIELGRSAIEWFEKARRYASVDFSAAAAVPAGWSGLMDIFYEVRLLSVPRDGEQGHKVFMVPGAQGFEVVSSGQ